MGVSSLNAQTEWHFAKMNCYSIKLYNRALIEEEVLDSYNTDVAYHQFLVNGGK